MKQPRCDDFGIDFGKINELGMEYPHVDPLVVSVVIEPVLVHWVLVDCGSSVNILYKDVFDQIKLSKKDLMSCKTPLRDFHWRGEDVVGHIDPVIEIGSTPRTAMRVQIFIVLDGLSTYNAF